MRGSFIDNLRRFDEGREGFPGEHWLAMAAGLWFLQRPGGSWPSKAIGAALLYRAASGRDGLQRLWSKAPASAGPKTLIGGTSDFR